MSEGLILIFLVFMILGAIIALEARDLLSSIISIGAVGFVLSACFLFLKAPDIAIVQIVVEILTLVILIRATISRDICFYEEAGGFFPFAINLVLVFIFAIFLLRVAQVLPAFGINTSRVASHYLANALKQTGASNAVTAVILDYRAYDTLGEATVLFTAVLGAVAILRRKAKSDMETRK